MLSRGRVVFLFVSLMVVAILVGGSLWAAEARKNDDGHDSPYKYLSMFLDVLDLVDRAYVDQTDKGLLMTGALDGAGDALDPFSQFVPEGAVARFSATKQIGTAHSGLLVLKERGVAYAMSVAPGSPAALAGLERGDLVAKLQGRSTREMPLWEIQGVLAGPVGTSIKAERIRLGEHADVEFELAAYAAPGVVLEAQRGIPVLKLSSLDPQTPRDLLASLDAVATSTLPGADSSDRLILDLRDLAGGDSQAAYDAAALFVAGELGALTRRGEVLEVFASEEAPKFQGEVAILVNRGTQGAAEVLATVLKQSAEASLVGERTFGHSGQSEMVPLSNGDRLLITTAFFTGPDREPLDEGIDPDVIVRPAAFELDADEDDLILERALEVLLSEDEGELQKAA